MLIDFTVLESFFIGHRDSCVRGLLARLAQVFSRRLKRAFVSTLRVSCCFCCCLFYCDQPGAGYHVLFFVTACCSLTAFARELVVLWNALW